jgi:putative transposase
LSTVSASQNVGIKKVSDKVWLVSFIQYDLGLFDQELGIMSTNEIPGFI